MNKIISLQTSPSTLLYHLSDIDKIIVENRYSSCVLITDENLYQMHQQNIHNAITKLPVHVILVPAGEQSKTTETAIMCWNKMIEFGLDRKSLLIAFGGGAITDLSGFVAGCYMRGIDTLYIPTTLLGMVDAAIGGKCGVNLAEGKNCIGIFHQPKNVIMDSSFLKTLPEREFRSGLAEVIKYGVIWDEEFFSYLEVNMEKILQKDPEVLKHIINRSCEIKMEIVNEDTHDRAVRGILNWGHTFGHALEVMTHYTKYVHGEAVSIGMNCAAQVSKVLGYVGEDFVMRQKALLERAGLPVSLPDVSLERLLHFMTLDKKAVAGKISLIISEGFGKAKQIQAVDPALIERALGELQSYGG